MWDWRNGARPKTLLLCAVCALLGAAGGTDPAPAVTRAADATHPQARALSAHGPRASARAPRVAPLPRVLSPA
ncbi:MAG: hypothetical protein QOD86_2836 [Miltoncostaeaceae bacterium]|jgi:hypothetical protein|nr:hypothetical protein [Miltoncostaeaceae bacterium]